MLRSMVFAVSNVSVAEDGGLWAAQLYRAVVAAATASDEGTSRSQTAGDAVVSRVCGCVKDVQATLNAVSGGSRLASDSFAARLASIGVTSPLAGAVDCIRVLLACIGAAVVTSDAAAVSKLARAVEDVVCTAATGTSTAGSSNSAAAGMTTAAQAVFGSASDGDEIPPHSWWGGDSGRGRSLLHLCCTSDVSFVGRLPRTDAVHTRNRVSVLVRILCMYARTAAAAWGCSVDDARVQGLMARVVNLHDGGNLTPLALAALTGSASLMDVLLRCPLVKLDENIQVVHAAAKRLVTTASRLAAVKTADSTTLSKYLKSSVLVSARATCDCAPRRFVQSVVLVQVDADMPCHGLD